MTETSPAAPHQPGVYVKGDSVRIASTAGTAAQLAYDGYALQGESPAPEADDNDTPDYRELQAQAKELDIDARQSAAELQKQIDAKLADQS